MVGGGGVGAEVADFLSEMGKEITVVELLEGIASDLVIHLQHYLLIRLAEKGEKWLEKEIGMTGIGLAFSTGKLKFKKGDFKAMISDPRMAGPFIKSFATAAHTCAAGAGNLSDPSTSTVGTIR